MLLMNTNTKGRIAEMIAMTKYLSLGYTVLQPVNKDGIYDFVIEKDNVFSKVQVKTLRDMEDKYAISFKSTSHNRTGNTMKNYSSTDIDLFVGVDIYNNKVVQIPFNKSNKSEMYLRKDACEKHSNQHGFNYVKDYEI